MRLRTSYEDKCRIDTRWCKKEIKYGLGKGKEHRNKMKISKSRRKNMRFSENADELANFAIMSKSALRGEVELSSTMK